MKSEYFPLLRPPLNIHQRSLISSPSRPPPPKLSKHLPIFHFWATEKKFTNTTKFATVSNFDSIFFQPSSISASLTSISNRRMSQTVKIVREGQITFVLSLKTTPKSSFYLQKGKKLGKSFLEGPSHKKLCPPSPAKNTFHHFHSFIHRWHLISSQKGRGRDRTKGKIEDGELFLLPHKWEEEGRRKEMASVIFGFRP